MPSDQTVESLRPEPSLSSSGVAWGTRGVPLLPMRRKGSQDNQLCRLSRYVPLLLLIISHLHLFTPFLNGPATTSLLLCKAPVTMQENRSRARRILPHFCTKKTPVPLRSRKSCPHANSIVWQGPAFTTPTRWRCASYATVARSTARSRERGREKKLLNH